MTLSAARLDNSRCVITGFNTDVKYRGVVYHVQTEDKGTANPLIETLIYKGGEILGSRRLPYGDLVKDRTDEPAITKLMEDQHKGMIMEVKRGRFDAAGDRHRDGGPLPRRDRARLPRGPRRRQVDRGATPGGIHVSVNGESVSRARRLDRRRPPAPAVPRPPARWPWSTTSAWCRAPSTPRAASTTATRSRSSPSSAAARPARANDPRHDGRAIRSILAGREFRSRLIVGTGKYPSFQVMREAHEASGADMVTVAVRRVDLKARGPENLLDHIDTKRIFILPNTAACYTADEAVRTARLGREAGLSHWVKLEVIGDEKTLYPDIEGLLAATRILVKEGFVVLPYTTDDVVVAKKLEDAGAAAVMPLGAPIGSGLGIQNRHQHPAHPGGGQGARHRGRRRGHRLRRGRSPWSWARTASS